MNPHSHRRWGHPSSILFATELPANERVFGFALAQARNSGSRLIIFHAYDTLVVSASETSGVRYYDYAAAARTELKHLEPLAERARAVGVDCEIVVHQGLAPQLILECAREKHVDRIVLGTRCPGPLGKILVGSVAEEVIRQAEVPVCTIGPEVVDQAFQGYKAKTIVLATSLNESAASAGSLAAEIAVADGARLILVHVIHPDKSSEALAHRTIEQIERDLKSLIPSNLRSQVQAEALVIPGEPSEEILFQAKTKQADVLILGAQEASLISTLTRHGVVYKILGHSPCPVFTLSPRALQTADETTEELNHEMHLARSV
jgi:nucleotide-binding universal stress UspA family protein